MDVIFYIGIVLFFLFGPWILMALTNSRRKRERLEDQSRWADLTARVHAMEREVRELRQHGSTTATQETPPKEAATETPPTTLAVPPPSKVPEPSVAAAEAWVTRRPDIAPAEIPSVYRTAESTRAAKCFSSTAT